MTRGEPCVIMMLTGVCVCACVCGGGGGCRGVIANDILKMGKVIDFQSLCPATAHLCRRSISRNSKGQVI